MEHNKVPAWFLVGSVITAWLISLIVAFSFGGAFGAPKYTGSCPPYFADDPPARQE